MAKNLIINRAKVFESKKEQEIYDEKVSINNLNDLLDNSGVPIIPKYSIKYAVYFGSDKDLIEFGKDLTTEKIVFEIK